MKRVGRYNLTELSLNRLMRALKARAAEIPHSLAWTFHPSARLDRERIRRYRGIHAGERCFIVANGPSINHMKLELLANEITFGMNRIYMLFDGSEFRPTYYVALDTLVLERFYEEIANLTIPKFLNWNRRAYYDMQDESTIFLKSRLVIRDSFQPDMTRPFVVGGTVTFAALQLAFYMGFQTVIIIGLDHNQFVKGIPSTADTYEHGLHDERHFHPDYLSKSYRWLVPDRLRSEIDYRLARAAYERAGREILDATIGGKCDVFEKVDYLSLFE